MTSILKNRAKIIDRESNNPSIYLGGLVFVLINMILTALIYRLSIPQVTIQEMQTIVNEANEAVQSGQYSYAYSLIPRPTPQANIISTVLGLLIQFIDIGFLIFTMNIVRKKGATLGNLLDGFQIPLRIFLLNLLQRIYIALWSLLFVIPGIIAIYKYRMAKYLMLDHPEWSVNECITKSKVLMKGHKMDIFLLDLSFLGWSILGFFITPVKIYTRPYKETTYLLFYQALTRIPAAMSIRAFLSSQEFFDSVTEPGNYPTM